MVGLRHIWTMSNYFCYDDKMENLLYKISYVFTEKIKAIIQLNNIFSRSATEAHELATKCAHLLWTWKETYMRTRAFIENSGVGSRWEFNKPVLFADVEHCARISQDIANIAEIFIEYENIFSQRLKTLISDPKDVDIMLKKVRIQIYFPLYNKH